ncbi:MAG: DUF5916 domain-containing protein [Longimicrobiales bacterium]|nr:DUF5916 domain-containing protein [Longimicrobiales bacterium]
MRIPFLVMALSVAGPVGAQVYDPPATRAIPVPEGTSITLDGSLDDPAWDAAPVTSGLRQREPDVGEPSAYPTEVRVLYDETALYIGIRAEQQGEPVIGRVLRRDRLMEAGFDGRPVFTGDDAVVVLLDPFHDHRNAFMFATNPNGAELDALLTDEGREFNLDWRGVWEARAERTPYGWSAELAIPFRTLRYPSGAGGEPWGLNVARVVRGSNEESLWSSYLRENEGMTRVSRAGHLLGLDRLPRAGLNLEVKPFVLAGATREDTLLGRPGSPAAHTATELDAGFDVKWEVRPGLTLDLTANTDFAQVEADAEQVNLTRFSLFFPEKRDFFLENAGVFEFGFRGFFEPPPFLLFFSRRIGIHEEGEVPVLGGARLTGRLGRQTVGFMNVTTDAAFGVPRTNFAVARVKRDVGQAGYIGAMVTDRRNADTWNTAGGLDASLWAGPVNVQALYARTETSGAGGDDHAWRVGLDYTGDRYGFGFNNIGVGPEATAEAGFITRTDLIRTDLFGRVTPRPDVLGIRKIDAYLGVNVFTDMTGRVEDLYVGPLLATEWSSGESLSVFVNPGFTRLDEPFDLGDVTVPPGEWNAMNLGWFASTSASRAVVLGSSGTWQSIYGGTIGSYGATLTVAPDPHVTTTLGYTRNRVALPGGAFDADLASLRLDLSFSTRAFLSALVQYNQLDNQLSANVRFNLIHSPGSDLYVVIDERRGSALDLWDPADRGVALKVTWLQRF